MTPQQQGQQLDPARTRRTIIQALLEARNTVGGVKPVLEDHERWVLTYDDLILAASVLGRKLARVSERGENIGVLLPNSVGAVVTFFALLAVDRVPAMLNYTGGANNLLAACATASVKTILTSRKFVEAGKFEGVMAQLSSAHQIVYLEDIRYALTLWDKLAGLSRSKTLRWKTHVHPDSPAAILFTSGAEGSPKAVVLSHSNFVSNVEQVRIHIGLDKKWIFFSPLPIFHSFGLTGGVLLPLLTGMRTFQYPSPLHHKQIPELVRETGAHILLATDTFLSQYARAASEGDLSSLKFVVCGAERVREDARRLMDERFSVPIVEGYGVTEAAPVIAVNKPVTNRAGTVGQLLPGIEWRLEDVPGLDEGGRLFVHGPNIMTGYIGAEGALIPPSDGWHDTGDVVTVDEAGFVTIAGRLKRFAKIAGEMVSLSAIEAQIAKLWPENVHAAIAIPDDRRGEQILLLTDNQSASKDALIAWAKSNGWPEIQLPKRVVVVDGIPVLGTGKIDYVSAERLLKEAIS